MKRLLSVLVLSVFALEPSNAQSVYAGIDGRAWKVRSQDPNCMIASSEIKLSELIENVRIFTRIPALLVSREHEMKYFRVKSEPDSDVQKYLNLAKADHRYRIEVEKSVLDPLGRLMGLSEVFYVGARDYFVTLQVGLLGSRDNPRPDFRRYYRTERLEFLQQLPFNVSLELDGMQKYEKRGSQRPHIVYIFYHKQSDITSVEKLSQRFREQLPKLKRQFQSLFLKYSASSRRTKLLFVYSLNRDAPEKVREFYKNVFKEIIELWPDSKLFKGNYEMSRLFDSDILKFFLKDKKLKFKTSADVVFNFPGLGKNQKLDRKSVRIGPSSIFKPKAMVWDAQGKDVIRLFPRKFFLFESGVLTRPVGISIRYCTLSVRGTKNDKKVPTIKKSPVENQAQSGQ